MRISYIITPFGSSEYLIRCVNSILRQTSGDNEIIIAENGYEISEENREYLAAKGIKEISDEPQTDFEKMTEAIKSVRENSLVKFIDIDTVAVPVASDEAAKCERDIVLAALAVKNNDGYYIEKPDGRGSLQSVFIKKELLENISQEALTDPFLFEIWLDKTVASGAEYGSVDDVCFYVQNEFAADDKVTARKYIDRKNDLLVIFENSLKNSGTKTGLTLFDKYLSALYKFMCSENYDPQTKEEIFGIVKDTARIIGENEFARRLFLLYFGADVDAIAGMDAQAYIFYSQRVLTLSDKTIVTAQLEQIVEDTTEPIKKSLSVISQIKSKQEEESEKTKALSKEISKLKNDIAALTKNMHFVFNSASAGGETGVYAEPLQQIPAMFAQGKLGFKVIIKSFKAWLKYKFSRKK